MEKMEQQEFHFGENSRFQISSQYKIHTVVHKEAVLITIPKVMLKLDKI
jgi:hypothetical protein